MPSLTSSTGSGPTVPSDAACLKSSSLGDSVPPEPKQRGASFSNQNPPPGPKPEGSRPKATESPVGGIEQVKNPNSAECNEPGHLLAIPTRPILDCGQIHAGSVQSAQRPLIQNDPRSFEGGYMNESPCWQQGKSSQKSK